MSSGFRWIEGYSRTQFLNSLGLLVQVVPHSAQSVVSVGPRRSEAAGLLELFESLAGVTLVLERQSQVKVGRGAIWFEREHAAVVFDGFIPRFTLGKLDGTFAIEIRCLCPDLYRMNPG